MTESKPQNVDPQDIDRAWSVWEGFLKISQFAGVLVVLALLLLLGIYAAG